MPPRARQIGSSRSRKVEEKEMPVTLTVSNNKKSFSKIVFLWSCDDPTLVKVADESGMMCNLVSPTASDVEVIWALRYD